MSQLENVSVGTLQDALQNADDVTAAKRIMVAIAYKQGVSQTELAEWYDLSRKTVYNWLRRFEEKPVSTAATDNARSGRPPKLDSDQRAELRRLLQNSPVIADYDADEWSVALVQRLVDDRFDITYSRTSAYRLLSSDE